MSSEKFPPFDEAVNTFHNFLLKESLGTNILWLFREDVVELWPEIYVKIPAENRAALVERLYRKGSDSGLGINLSMFCLLDDRPCSYISHPAIQRPSSA